MMHGRQVGRLVWLLIFLVLVFCGPARANGNVTAANGKTFSYDSQNELLSMNGGAVQMLYDGDGNRVAKSVTSGGVTTTTYYLVDDLNPTGYPQVMDETN